MTTYKVSTIGIVLLLLSIVLTFIGAGVGSTGLESVFHLHQDPVALQIVMDIRAPRASGAWLAGALLGLAGAVAQGLFRNPLADPYLLGSASGASLGVAVVLALLGTAPFATGWFIILGLTSAAFAGAVGGCAADTVAGARRGAHAAPVAGGCGGGRRSGCSGPAHHDDAARGSCCPCRLSFWAAPVCGLGRLRRDGRRLAGCSVVAWALSPVLDGLSLGEATAASLGLHCRGYAQC